MTLEACKKIAGKEAVKFIKNGMLVGLGTGSTVYYFIDELIRECAKGLHIKAVSSSEKSTVQAKAGGISFADINTITSIDVTVDGADEIDPKNRMIKGGGGALLREKIIASCSKEVIIIVDESKVVSKLGKQKLPIEILPYATQATIQHIHDLGFIGSLRKGATGGLYHTDNGNFIYDIVYPNLIEDPERDHMKLTSIPGVLETGFFFNLAKKVFIGYKNGHIEKRG